MSKRRAKRNRLRTGEGSGTHGDMVAPPGFQRESVLDDEGRASMVIRRIDNLLALRAAIGAERVNALICLRMASEAMERGLTPRCGLDMSPGAGPDGFLQVIAHRIDASVMAGLLWGAVPEACARTVRLVVLQGASLNDVAAQLVVRRGTALGHVRGQLEVSADGIIDVLDVRFGRAQMRAMRVA